MKRLVSCILAIPALLWGCAGPKTAAPEYPTHAAKIVAEIHDPASEYVVVASHRGDWRNYPENSIPAIESVIRMGVDIMELDLKLTKDSVLFHEKLGYTMVGTFHQCGYKFHRWYDMVWMEKFIGEHRENQPDIIPFPKLKLEK